MSKLVIPKMDDCTPMITRMSHPEHGFTHAYTPDELASLKERGWRVEPEENNHAKTLWPKEEPTREEWTEADEAVLMEQRAKEQREQHAKWRKQTASNRTNKKASKANGNQHKGRA